MSTNDHLANPFVSVIMNAYYSDEFLEEAIASVVAQTHSNWEIVLWENVSSDRARLIAASFNDRRIRYFHSPVKASLYESRMNAFKVTKGELIAFLDCDDYWYPTKLAAQAQVFSDPACSLSCTDYETQYFLKDDAKPIVKDYFETYSFPITSLTDALMNYKVGMSTLMFRKSLGNSILPTIPPSYSMIEDLDIVARLLTVGYLIPINIPLSVYRRHAASYSSQHDPFGTEWDEWIGHIPDLGLSEDESIATLNWAKEKSRMNEMRKALMSASRLQIIRGFVKYGTLASSWKFLVAFTAPTIVKTHMTRLTP